MQVRTVKLFFRRLKTRKLFPADRIQQCCAAPHEHCCQQYVTVLSSITSCNNIVDNNVHGVQRNIVEACFINRNREPESCFHQPCNKLVRPMYQFLAGTPSVPIFVQKIISLYAQCTNF